MEGELIYQLVIVAFGLVLFLGAISHNKVKAALEPPCKEEHFQLKRDIDHCPTQDKLKKLEDDVMDFYSFYLGKVGHKMLYDLAGDLQAAIHNRRVVLLGSDF